MNAPPADRAADLHAAFADPDIKAVLATIGGEDEVTVLPHLDTELLAANPELFLGFSDNTCLLACLHELGVVETELELEPCEGWTWHNADRVVEGASWGGNLETLGRLLTAGRIGSSERFAGHVLFVETSEELPSAGEVYRTLRDMGERGLLRQFPAVLVGRPKAWSL